MDLYKLFLLEVSSIVVLRINLHAPNHVVHIMQCTTSLSPVVNMYFSYFGGRVVMQKALCMALHFSSAIW